MVAAGELLLPDLAGQGTQGDMIYRVLALLSNWVIYYSRVLASTVQVAIILSRAHLAGERG